MNLPHRLTTNLSFLILTAESGLSMLFPFRHKLATYSSYVCYYCYFFIFSHLWLLGALGLRSLVRFSGLGFLVDMV